MEPKTANRPGLEEIFAQWSDEDQADTVTLDFGHARSNVSITSPYTVGTGINFPNTVYTTAGTSSSPWVYNPNGTRAKIQLDGEGADIEINGISLLKTMQEIQSRLNLLQPNTALEAEWEELFELGKKYRALEQQIKEKQATWDKLKAMPPPEID
jgi:hypothetical protein